ncbi:MAG: (2Fe-2S)-binding protein [Planctomycetaceae bacterium]|nr:(2Fe-2S)-binding protein [Planctomycetaceae bacterium]
MSSANLRTERTDQEANPVVCHCFRIRESKIREAIELYGATSVGEIRQQTNAGGGCHGCQCRIKRMLAGERPVCSVFQTCDSCGFNAQCCDCKAD